LFDSILDFIKGFLSEAMGKFNQGTNASSANQNSFQTDLGIILIM
jgi:hypothetical protein